MNLIDPDTHAWVGTRNLSNGSQSRQNKSLKMSKIIRDNSMVSNAYY